eukprot:1094963-Heterocapsa_arctica.AAC.1
MRPLARAGRLEPDRHASVRPKAGQARQQVVRPPEESLARQAGARQQSSQQPGTSRDKLASQEPV